MKQLPIAAVLACCIFLAAAALAAQWATPQARVIPAASGYIPIPQAAVMPEAGHVYKAVYDATHGPDQPTQILPALDMAGSELNLFGATGFPLKNVKFVIVFHGAALDGILDDAHYRAKYKVGNPNLKALAQLRKAGVEMFVCGQNLAALDIERRAVVPEVKIALDALVVLMAYQNNGYALLSF